MFFSSSLHGVYVSVSDPPPPGSPRESDTRALATGVPNSRQTQCLRDFSALQFLPMPLTDKELRSFLRSFLRATPICAIETLCDAAMTQAQFRACKPASGKGSE
ncbi:MAG: hypothetical protein MI753_04710 [Hyphomicrobiales bacterium]|nr:hypothetical protein [Hyphomicrobiales bacterium]